MMSFREYCQLQEVRRRPQSLGSTDDTNLPPSLRIWQPPDEETEPPIDPKLTKTGHYRLKPVTPTAKIDRKQQLVDMGVNLRTLAKKRPTAAKKKASPAKTDATYDMLPPLDLPTGDKTRDDEHWPLAERLQQLVATENARKVPFINWIMYDLMDSAAVPDIHEGWRLLRAGQVSKAKVTAALYKVAGTGLGKLSYKEFMTILPHIKWVPPLDQEHMKNLPADNGMMTPAAIKKAFGIKP